MVIHFHKKYKIELILSLITSKKFLGSNQVKN